MIVYYYNKDSKDLVGTDSPIFGSELKAEGYIPANPELVEKIQLIEESKYRILNLKNLFNKD